MKTALVLGAGGFIGNHMVNRLKSDGYWVRGADLNMPVFSQTNANEFLLCDLRVKKSVEDILVNSKDNRRVPFDEVYQFAADMGGAEFIFSGENDAEIMHNSALINLNLLESQVKLNKLLDKNSTKIFYSSSACIYPDYNQQDPLNPNCLESSAYPANPDSNYGWEKLFSERIFLAYSKNYGIPVAIARLHNIYGPGGSYQGGREKAPAAICRKVILASLTDSIEIFGDGNQTRSFLYIEDCINAISKLMSHSTFFGPVNIGSEELVSINKLVYIISQIACKNISINHIDGPIGVNGRNSENTLIRRMLDWEYRYTLFEGLTRTYSWIEGQIAKGKIE
jgi:GDP-D-mannose 3',5'-epimerase